MTAKTKLHIQCLLDVVEASFNWCPVLPVNGLLEQDQSPCGRGSIVVYKNRLWACRSFRLRSGVDVVVGGVEEKAQVVLLLPVCERTKELSSVYGISSPASWKRGSPLSPIVGGEQVS